MFNLDVKARRFLEWYLRPTSWLAEKLNDKLRPQRAVFWEEARRATPPPPWEQRDDRPLNDETLAEWQAERARVLRRLRWSRRWAPRVALDVATTAFLLSLAAAQLLAPLALPGWWLASHLTVTVTWR